MMSGSFCPKGFSFSASTNFLCYSSSTQIFCLPALNIPPSRIVVRLHLIGTQNQLKSSKKMPKLLMAWSGWWNSNRRPHQPAPDKKARALALLMPCQGLWIGTMPGSQLHSHLAAPLFQELIHITESVCHEEWPPGTEAAAHPCHFCKAGTFSVRSLAWTSSKQMSWTGLVLTPEPRNIPLTPFTKQKSLLLLAAVADRHLRREGQGVERQHRLKDSWHKSGKKENTESQSTASAFLQEQCLALSSFSVTILCSFTRAWTWSGIFLLFPCPHLILPAILGWAAFSTSEGWCPPRKMCGSMYWKSQSKAEFFSLEGIPSEITYQLQTAWKSMLTVHIRPTCLHTFPRLPEIFFNSSLFREESLTWTLIHHDPMS